ncbi:hypothetical protein EC973_000486 [Apophysomyces ossiformis]|uniref:Uncharacterized protein n=1 Tax=Apophysomyces ossiformis TaxID=679940 RepID=A0A8H7BQB5_9FUNG|nr:hypothetical protein EC973_000486 [Apophysomyces ossiformis]
MSRNYFGGYEELKLYMISNRNPSLDAFVQTKLDHIVEWSLPNNAMSAQDLFDLWRQRFIRMQQEWKPHAKVKSVKMAQDTWQTIASIKKERLHAKATYTHQSLRVLNSYGKVTADTLICDAITSSSSSFSVTQQDDTQAKSEQLDTNEENAPYQQAPSDHDYQEDEDDDASGGNIKELLFAMGYKKFKGMDWNQKEKALLNEVGGGNPFLDITSGLDAVVVTILNKTHQLDDIDLSLLKLCLSRIVNLLNPAHVSRMKLYHPTDFGQDQVDKLIDSFNNYDLTERSADLLDQISTHAAGNGACVGDVLAMIDDAKRPLLRNNRHSQEYRVLKILEYTIETAEDWDLTDSETTVYRRVASVMDHLFRSTGIKLADGETASNCTKDARQFNEIIYDSSSQNTMHGRKIDLLLKQKNGGEHDIELSSNEFKRHCVTPNCAVIQQCKNLRINGAILGHMEALDQNRRCGHTVAMDWVGNVGYLYMLANVNDVYIAKKICILRLPKSLADVASFKSTLLALLRYQHFIVELGKKTQCTMQARQDLETLCEIIDTTDDTVAAHPKHKIFFTPQRHGIKKAKH